ncbi:MAG TPA: alpha/beta hydrolase [Myxococcota bacterium]
METFEHEGLPIRYVRAGCGEPVVCLHDGGASPAIWSELATALAPDYEVFALDLLGAGATLERSVAILGAFVDARALAPVRLVGNGMGSAAALALASRRPRDVAALVLSNPLTAATLTAGRLGPWLRLHERAPRLARALHARRFAARRALRFQLGSAGRARRVHEDPELLASYTSAGWIASLLGALDDRASYEALDRLAPGPEFPPLCTIWGLDNRVLAPSAGRVLNQRLRPQREEWLEDCGHLPMRESPERVTATVRAFFAGVPRRRVLPVPVSAARHGSTIERPAPAGQPAKQRV